jgi:drug/metabolite transporter (DMT)-like permease
MNTPQRRLEIKGTLLVALSGMLFGLMGFLGTKILYLQFSVENMLFWRFLIASCWMLLGAIFIQFERTSPVRVRDIIKEV